MKKKGLTYADSGVDIKAGDRAVDIIKKRTQKTFRFYPGRVLSGIGGFSAAVELPDKRVMLASTDGVGTKLMLAIFMNIHHSVGIDLVAMCVNDIAVAGATPVMFLDYMAMGKQIPQKTASIISGIVDGCEIAECALAGGEMAEMPGMYDVDDYDLAGFAIGFAESKKQLILGNTIKPGMFAYGIPSSGAHSNGFTLLRNVFDINLDRPKKTRKILEKHHSSLGATLGKALLEPTTIYVKLIKKLIAEYDITGMAHITGGGLVENPPRILPNNCALQFKKNSWEVHPIFEMIQKKGNVSEREMLKTFNMGIGLIVISPDKIDWLPQIGKIVKRNSGQRRVTFKK